MESFTGSLQESGNPAVCESRLVRSRFVHLCLTARLWISRQRFAWLLTSLSTEHLKGNVRDHQGRLRTYLHRAFYCGLVPAESMDVHVAWNYFDQGGSVNYRRRWRSLTANKTWDVRRLWRRGAKPNTGPQPQRTKPITDSKKLEAQNRAGVSLEITVGQICSVMLT